jgi:hypothetical protein
MDTKRVRVRKTRTRSNKVVEAPIDVEKVTAHQQIQLLEWQLRQFDEHVAVDKTAATKKMRKKQKKEKKENLTEMVIQEREKKNSIYNENLKTLKRKRHPALVNKQKELLKLLQNKE